MFAGAAARDEVLFHLNDITNAMNLECNAHTSYAHLEWGIEAKDEGGQVRLRYQLLKVTDALIRSNTFSEQSPLFLMYAAQGSFV